MASAGNVGAVHPYYDDLAIVLYLNEHFGYNLTVPEFQAEDSPWDERHLQMHFDYIEVFRTGNPFSYFKPSDENIVKIRQKNARDRLKRKGSFAVLYELGKREN